MLDAANEAGVWRIVFMTGAGVGKTSVIDAILGYFSTQDPSPILAVLPTLVEARGYSIERLSPMIAETPTLREIFGTPRSRDADNTLLHKDFPGGYLALAGANSAASLQRRHVRIVLCDELDSFPPDADGEGDPADLAVQRAARFEWNRLIIFAGTPTIEGASRLERAFAESDQRRFWIPCTRCSEFQVLRFEQVKWTNRDPSTARYVCEACSYPMNDAERLTAIREAESRGGGWRAERPFAGTAGFHIWEAYATSSLAGLVAEWLEKQKAKTSLQTFVNKKLGQLWRDEEQGEGVDWLSLKSRAEDYPLIGDPDFVLPEGVLLVVAGVDVQNDRIAVQVLGFGRGEECWVLLWHEIEGDPIDDARWAELDSLTLNRQLPHPLGGHVAVRSQAVDTGGLRTQAAYNYCRQRPTRVVAVKGSSQAGRPVIAGRPAPQDVSWSGRKIPKGVLLWTVGTDTAKSEIYARIGLTRNDDGSFPSRYVHFSNRLPDQYFEQVVSEKLRTKFKAGVPYLEWYLPPGKRNEALDTFVYAYFAATRLGLQRANWDDLADATHTVEGKKASAPPPPPPRQRENWLAPRRQWLIR